MNVSRVSTKNYEKRTLGGVGKTKPNKANSKPIQSQFKANQSQSKPIKANLQKAENERNQSIKKGLRKNIKLGNLPKTNPIQSQTNPTCSELVESISPPQAATIFIFSVAKTVNPALYSENTNY